MFDLTTRPKQEKERERKSKTEIKLAFGRDWRRDAHLFKLKSCLLVFLLRLVCSFVCPQMPHANKRSLPIRQANQIN